MTMRAPKLVIAGGAGFLGQALSEWFTRQGWEVVILARNSPNVEHGRVVQWNGQEINNWRLELENATALVNLCGQSVNCRYTPSNRAGILDSRITPTRLLGRAIAACANPPRVWLNASTATIYKHSFDTAMDEAGMIAATPEAKDAFSVEVATAWETAFGDALTPKTRKVVLRTAMVLGHARNSVLPTLVRLVRFGLGGPMAHGRQFVSWIHVSDFCRAVEWLIGNEGISGIVNLAAPNPLTNRAMMRTLRRWCGVPVGLPAPLWMLEIGAWLLRTETELIIKSRRVVPGRLLKAGFEFNFTTFADALADLLPRRKRTMACQAPCTAT